MDNIFLIRDIIEVSGEKEQDVGLLSIDKEKAFDGVDHTYPFRVLEAYGLGEKLTAWRKLLYNKASVMVKVF